LDESWEKTLNKRTSILERKAPSLYVSMISRISSHPK
jgi:hypothetical protein